MLSSILGTAGRYQLLVKNPIEGVQLPPKRRGKKTAKPNNTAEQFDQILAGILEPYATMVFVCVLIRLRVFIPPLRQAQGSPCRQKPATGLIG
jgi:hypothetical protein